MNLLVVASRPPWPPVMADAMTVDRTLRYLAGRGHAVDLCCFTESRAQERELRAGLGGVCRRIESVRLPRWRSYWTTALGLPGRLPMQVDYYRSPAMAELVARVLGEGDHDLVYTHLIRMAEYTRHLDRPVVVNLVVSQALNYGRLLEYARDPLRRLFYGIERARVRSYEVALCADVDRVIVCGPADREALEREAPLDNVFVNPHGQDVPDEARVRAARREPGTIVLSGVMSTFTNVDAALWFAGRILPRIERAVPGAAFWIVGRTPQRAVRALARAPRVVVTGEVPDVNEWLLRAEVAVAPLRIAAGMQNKLVQAMACETAVVATPVANEGIRALPDLHLRVREDEEEFAGAVIELLRDPEARERLGRAARRHVAANWTWEALFLRLEQELLAVAGGPAAPGTQTADSVGSSA